MPTWYQCESGKCAVANLTVDSVQTVTLHRGTETPLRVLLRLLLRYHRFAFVNNVKLCHISMHVVWRCGQLAGKGMP